MKIYNQILAAILMTALTGCEKELDFKYHDIDPIVVIEGELTPDGAKVGITMTTPMDEPMDRTHLTDATVRIEDITEGLRMIFLLMKKVFSVTRLRESPDIIIA